MRAFGAVRKGGYEAGEIAWDQRARAKPFSRKLMGWGDVTLRRQDLGQLAG